MEAERSVTVRLLRRRDIPFGMELKNRAGWNQLPEDWERYLAWEPKGCFLARWRGEPAGTAVTITYGHRCGWIGAVLVLPELQRRGIGAALMGRCLDYLDSRGVDTVKLDSTEAGRPLYERLGFIPEYSVARYEAAAKGSAGSAGEAGVKPLQATDLEAVCAFDAAAFGADRSRVLRSLHAAGPGWVLHGAASPIGYLFRRPGLHADYLGPWVGEAPEAAEPLLQRALRAVAGRRVAMDVNLGNPLAAGLAEHCGLVKQREFLRMVRGSNTFPVRTDLIYASAGPEIG